MAWNEQFPADRQPSWQQIDAFIGSELWHELNDDVKNAYRVEPKTSYSGCSMQRGWNIKYQKGGKSLCTLYPMPGFFIALIVIGAKEEAEAEMLMPACSPYVQSVFRNTDAVMGGRWLMLSVMDPAILADVKALIRLRVKPR